MTTVEITIGWTRSDMDNGYSSFDGYRPGAQQHTEVVTVDVPIASDRENDLEWAVLAMAEAAFAATNHPDPAVGRPEGQIYTQLRERGFNGSQSGHYSLSVGDTVTCGEVTLACASFGWERVTHV